MLNQKCGTCRLGFHVSGKLAANTVVVGADVVKTPASQLLCTMELLEYKSKICSFCRNVVYHLHHISFDSKCNILQMYSKDSSDNNFVILFVQHNSYTNIATLPETCLHQHYMTDRSEYLGHIKIYQNISINVRPHHCCLCQYCYCVEFWKKH